MLNQNLFVEKQLYTDMDIVMVVAIMIMTLIIIELPIITIVEDKKTQSPLCIYS